KWGGRGARGGKRGGAPKGTPKSSIAKSSTAKSSTAAKAAGAPKPARSSTPAAAKAEIARLVLELQEARERQAATSEVLSLIADAPTDLATVFDRIVKNAAQLCHSGLSAVYPRRCGRR